MVSTSIMITKYILVITLASGVQVKDAQRHYTQLDCQDKAFALLQKPKILAAKCMAVRIPFNTNMK